MTRSTFDLPIPLDRSVPLHQALYKALRDAILDGRLRPGRRVPSSRDLGGQLDIARGTVVQVYARLVSEGYLVAQPGSGTVVAAHLPDRWFAAPASSPRAPPRGAPLRLSRWGSALQGSPFGMVARKAPRPFRPHVPALDAFPTEIWGRLLSRRARRDEALLLADSDVRGYRPLRDVLAEHLRVARGVVCSADQVVILPSVQQAIDLVGRLTLDPGEEVWMEDPGYTGAHAIFRSLGARMVPVPVDDDGICVAEGIRRAPSARLAYVTPGHQAPLGVTMPVERRMALLEWAGSRGAVVLEDDYDSEYRYEGRPVPALQGLDRAGVVVHTGTFGKTLLPSLRLAYAVVPPALLDRFVAAKSIVDRFTPPLAQAALADFLEEGHFARHLRRTREIYATRRAALLSALTSHLGDTVQIVGASAGLDLTVRFPPKVHDQSVSEYLAASGVEAAALSRHSMECRDSGLVLGFAPFAESRLRKGVLTLREALAGAAGASGKLSASSREARSSSRR